MSEGKMVGFKILVVLSVVLFCADAQNELDQLEKCGKDDASCHKNLLQTVLKLIAKTGISSLDIPKIDPMPLDGLNVALPNLANITLIDGAAKGIKDCTVNKFHANFDKGHAVVDVVCDILIKGHYSVFADGPIVKNFLGGEITGNGNGKAKIEKFRITFDFEFSVEKRGEDLYIKGNIDKAKYTYDIGKMLFAADNIVVGGKEQSATIVKLMNENWRVLMDMVGKQFVQKAMDFVFDFIQKFFNNVPIKKYIKDADSLNSYVS